MERCVSCGRFLKFEPGVSWAHSWSYDTDGCPDLHDARFQCAPCTEKHGRLGTNCYHPERYSGVYTAENFNAIGQVADAESLPFITKAENGNG